LRSSHDWDHPGAGADGARTHHTGGVVAAVAWGTPAASSLVIGALVGVVRPWPGRAVGAVLGFGAGALISAVSFDLAEEGLRLGGADSVALGLALGAMTYYLADRAIERPAHLRGHRAVPAADSGAGSALALGAFLDGIPEQLVLGIGLVPGRGVSIGLLAAIFASNLPEAVGSAAAMRSAGHSVGSVVRLWGVVAVVCTLATVAGFAVADTASGDLQAVVNGFAAGALLVMLIDTMVPEAARRAGKVAGLVTVLGFAVAAGLSGLQ
jgi:zinc transporter, ZIP family